MDCLEGLRQLERESVSVTVTSPPYNIGVEYKSYDDTRPQHEYLAWIRAVGEAIHGVLEPEGSFFLNVGSRRPIRGWRGMSPASYGTLSYCRTPSHG